MAGLLWLRPAKATDVAMLTVGAGTFFVVLAVVWLWDALSQSPLSSTVPYATALLAAGVVLVAVGGYWYHRAKRATTDRTPSS
jgi:apolipoprotein N-acyltransferase